MAYFRNKPVVIQAVQWTGDNHAEINAFLRQTEFTQAGYIKGRYVDIGTMEGLMVASPGDWIIKGIKGEFCPCKPDIFAATHEPADPPRSEP